MACLHSVKKSVRGPIRLMARLHVLADGDRPRSNPLAGIEQIHYRVVPTRGEVATARVERGGDTATNVSSEVFAQREGRNVDDADGMLRHVGKDHAVSSVIEHRR
jgi:hypothetical protein